MAEAELVAIPQDDYAPRFVMTVAEAKGQIKQLQEFVQSVMVEGEDYGKIPGTPKPTLLKPGAEKLCEIYGLAPTMEVTNRVEDWEKGFFHYEVKARLISKRTGIVVAEGVGSCNSRESRYADRWTPEWKLRGEDLTGLKWREKKNDKGTYKEYKIQNDDPYTLVNTILKMAKKRALVDAALSATRSSGIFTQDVEDMNLPQADKPQPQAAARPAPPSNGSSDLASEAQRKKIYATCRGLGVSDEQAKAWILERYGAESSKALTKRQASDFIEWLMSPEVKELDDPLDNAEPIEFEEV